MPPPSARSQTDSNAEEDEVYITEITLDEEAVYKFDSVLGIEVDELA